MELKIISHGLIICTTGTNKRYEISEMIDGTINLKEIVQ